MPFSTDVNVPRGHTVEFPDRCIGCGIPARNGYVRFARRTVSWLGVVIPYLGRNYVIDVPCCAGCESGIVGQRRKRNLALWGASILVAFIVFPYLDGLARPLRKPVGLAVFLVLLAPVLYVQFLRPPPFDLYVRSGNVDLEFEDADYAAEVYALNSHAGATIN